MGKKNKKKIGFSGLALGTVDGKKIAEIEFTKKQVERFDEVDNAAFDFCKVLADNYDLEWNISFIGEIVETAGRIMEEHGFPVRYPTAVLNNDGFVDHMTDRPFKKEARTE